jgi:hypothetical protein
MSTGTRVSPGDKGGITECCLQDVKPIVYTRNEVTVVPAIMWQAASYQRNVNKLELDDVVCNSEAVTMATFTVYSGFFFFWFIDTFVSVIVKPVALPLQESHSMQMGGRSS